MYFIKIINIKNFLYLLFFILNLSSSIANATAEQLQFKQYVLDNGLKILLKQNNNNPIVILQLWYKSAQNNIYKLIQDQDIELIKQALFMKGANSTTFTPKDHIAYSHIMPASELELGLNLESKKMIHWHGPNNATLIIAGNININKTYALIKKYFANIASNNKNIEFKIHNQEHKSYKTISQLLIKYKVPSLNTATENWEPFAIKILTNILNKYLINNNIISNVSYDIFDNSWSKVEILTLLNTQDLITIENIKQLIMHNINNLKLNVISKQELTKIKQEILDLYRYEQSDLFNQVYLAGSLNMAGYHPNLLIQQLEEINDITPKQIQMVAKKYFIKENLTINNL